MGIEGPYIDHIMEYARYSYKVLVDHVGLTSNGSWIIIDRGRIFNSRIMEPGKPMLPVKTYMIIIDGYVGREDVRVWVRAWSYYIIPLDKPVKPAPKPLAYMPGSDTTPRSIPDTDVYGVNRYYPGRIVDLDVWYGLGGRTIIAIRYYPIQYNPVENKLVVVDGAEIYVNYPKPSITSRDVKGLLIITSEKLVDEVKPLEDLYSDKGFRVSVVTVEYIYGNIEPAENITSYTGFYNPRDTEFDFIYPVLVSRYNWTLALKIINYIRGVMANYSHILLVGNSSTIPPSFYYKSSSPGTYDSWIPTDLFYASPNYDPVPDLYVGRIPFSDPDRVSRVVDKIVSWYNTDIPHSRRLYMSGGYVFLRTLMFGETTLSTYVIHGSTTMFNTTLLTRTSGNYNRSRILNILRGRERVLWYYALSHGSGDALLDYKLTSYGSTIETLASVSDLLSMDPNPAVPIISSVACVNAAWDEDILESPYFYLLSFGEAVLLSPAGGIAYIGSSRIAYEYGIMFDVDKGSLTSEYYGAALLHEEIIKAYNDLSGRGLYTTLGEVVARGIVNYLVDAVIGAGDSLGEVMKLELLGDPALTPPLFPGAYTGKRVYDIEPLNVDVYIPAYYVDYADGGIPFYKLIHPGNLTIEGSDGEYDLYMVRIIGRYGILRSCRGLFTDKLDVENGISHYVSIFNESINGLLLLKITSPGWGEYRFVMGSSGVFIGPRENIAGGGIHIRAYGLDAIGIYSVDIYVAGMPVASVPVIEGNIEWDAALPYLAPGEYPITIVPRISYYSVFKELKELFTTNVTIYERGDLTIVASYPSITDLDSDLRINVSIMYKGIPVDANLTVYVEGPDSGIKPVIEETGLGEYAIIVPVETPGTYHLYIEAVKKNSTLRVYGRTSAVITVVENLYYGFRDINNAINNTLYTLNQAFIDISDRLEANNKLLNNINDKTETLTSYIQQLIDKADKISREFKDQTSSINRTAMRKFEEEGETLVNISNYVIIAIIMATLAFIASLTSIIKKK